MATRERKARNVTESPTSANITDTTSIGVPSKPTTPTKSGRGRIRGRASTRTSANNEDNESVKSNDDDSTTKSTPQRSSSRMSTSSSIKEENENECIKLEEPKSSPGRPTGRRMKSEVASENFTKRVVRSNSDLMKRSPLLKRKSLPIASARGMGRKRGNGRRSFNVKPVSPNAENKNDTHKIGRGRKANVTANKKLETNDEKFKKPASIENLNEEEIPTDTEANPTDRKKMSSKSSDTTTTLSDVNDDFNDKVKEETFETQDDNKKQEILEKMAQNFSDTKLVIDDMNPTRRSNRPRKSTCKDKDDAIKETEVKKETKQVENPIEILNEPEYNSLKISTDNPIDSVNIEAEKDSSLSPQLVSEGVSEISVKKFYGEPDFLENNLGIEKDPKLGEIVQVNSKISCSLIESVNEPTTKLDEIATKIEDKIDVTLDIESKIHEDSKVEKLSEIQVQNIMQEASENSSNLVELTQKTTTIEDNKENTVKKIEDIVPDCSQNDESEKVKTNICMNESPDTLKEKEKHLLSLGLLSHEAAVEAAKEKRKRREILQRTIAKTDKKSKTSEYTGTLKTIIKLNRTSPEKRKTRMPLKITFAKGKTFNKSIEKDPNGSTVSVENTFYTIHQEKQVDQQQESHNNEKSRKGHNRFNNENNNTVETSEPVKQLVVPEKASSFKVHPGRLCLDQCFYCGGKFGLYDTPCHIAQIKSIERQNKILSSEEKLTRDSCLCDACFRHVDRKANCESYRKRLSGNTTHPIENENRLEMEESQHETYDHQKDTCEKEVESECCVTQCSENVMHSLRKKWLLKTKKQVIKYINIDEVILNRVVNYVPICDTHYKLISHLMVCAMCKKKLPKNHIFYIAQDIPRLEYLIYNQGIPIKLGNSALIVCKLCRYYANLLLKPSDDRPQKETFIKNYSKRLLQMINTETSEIQTDTGELFNNIKQTTKLREMRKVKKMSSNFPKNSIEPEISIIPSKPHTSETTTGHILLDNDVMVDYDNPLIDNDSMKASFNEKSQNKFVTKTEIVRKDKDMTRALKSNPHISMRELFPGEEDMNLNVKIPFNSGASRTPEGWARVCTTIQYDEDTRNLWEELQKPYGNQSSFLKHLILLEKYFRNGDLVLSQNASSNAVTYSESVQNRLRSYDSSIKNVINESTSSSSNSSINILQQLSNAPITLTPAAKNKSKISNSTNYSKGSNTNTSFEGIKRKLGNLEKFGNHKSNQSASCPPNKQVKIDDLTKPNLPPDLISINASQMQKCGTSIATLSPQKKSPNITQQVIKLPDTLTASERKQTAKPWRPTLIPITTGSSSNLNSGPLYQTADGRKLPALVQVMSGGKPYHISIHDYNRMCILRREKLWQIQKQQQQQQEASGDAVGLKMSNQQQSPNDKNKQMVQIPNTLLEQNSLIPISNAATIAKPQNSSTNEANGTKGKKSGNSLLKNFVPIAPKLPNSTSVLKIPTESLPDKGKPTKAMNVVQSTSASTSMLDSNSNSSLLNTNSNNSASAIEALVKSQLQNQFWLWGDGANPNVGQTSLLNNSSGGLMVDNSLLSKIPKSLTVIPQQRNRNIGDTLNAFDDNNPSTA